MAIPITKPTVGGSAGQWGAELNTALDALANGAQPAGNYVAAPATAPTDGQLVAWNATLGQWVAVNPSGASELAYAESIGGAYQTVAVGAPVDVNDCVISVPISARPVYLSAHVYFKLTTTGVGITSLQLLETTSGLAVIAVSVHVLHGEPTTTDEQSFQLDIPPFRVGPTTGVRTFKLDVALFADSGAPAGIVYNGLGGLFYKSYLAAEAR